MNDGDRRDEIMRLEAQIDELADRIESCRKFILTGRIAVAGGGLVLIATLVGAIRFDPWRSRSRRCSAASSLRARIVAPRK